MIDRRDFFGRSLALCVGKTRCSDLRPKAAVSKIIRFWTAVVGVRKMEHGCCVGRWLAGYQIARLALTQPS